jgi:hypothetical protein
MLGKKLVWSAMAVLFLMNAGCGRWCDRWCDKPHRQMRHETPICCPPPQCCPPPSPGVCYSSPPPPVGTPTPGTEWRRSPNP